MRYFQIQEGIDLPNLSEFKPFKVVVVIEEAVSDSWQTIVSESIVNSGCYYMMAWGKECSSWDNSVDLANIAKYKYEIPDDGFLTTTWHDDETLKEVFWFAKNLAFNEYHELEETIILHISKTNKSNEFSFVYKKA